MSQPESDDDSGGRRRRRHHGRRSNAGRRRNHRTVSSEGGTRVHRTTSSSSGRGRDKDTSSLNDDKPVVFQPNTRSDLIDENPLLKDELLAAKMEEIMRLQVLKKQNDNFVLQQIRFKKNHKTIHCLG